MSKMYEFFVRYQLTKSLSKTQNLKKFYIKENSENFDHIATLLNGFNEKRYKASFNRKNEIANLEKEIIISTSNLQKKSNLIDILREKKIIMKKNLERIKQLIDEKKKVLEIENSKLQNEKIQENNALIIISNIRRHTFSFILE